MAPLVVTVEGDCHITRWTKTQQKTEVVTWSSRQCGISAICTLIPEVWSLIPPESQEQADGISTADACLMQQQAK